MQQPAKCRTCGTALPRNKYGPRRLSCSTLCRNRYNKAIAAGKTPPTPLTEETNNGTTQDAEASPR